MYDDGKQAPRARESPLILFDGVCNLCNAAVQWILARDRRGVFRFASLQSETAKRMLAGAGADASGLPDSIVLLDGSRLHTRSDAALRIARRLGFPYSLAVAAMLLPRSIRDGLYAQVARNRYRWFGRRESCLAPFPDLRDRFLDAGDPHLAATADTPSRTQRTDSPGLR
jgi:predicted DCC family thiol-disulfide oxidoreductase YuxK